LESTENILPPDNPQVFSRLDKLAKCLIKEKKYEDAEKLYLRAQDFWKVKSSNDGSEARTLYALGSLYVLEKKYTAALPVLQKALQLAENYYGPDSISLVPYLVRCSDAMYYVGQDKERGQLKARASIISGIVSQ
ncbi:MAG: tetratricopeptide repeat protein, partial [Candidatus Melainabacteria bacterium]|nr:tetratricopeptide repeat protein [Candidatus Melainabacteria bacterium]